MWDETSEYEIRALAYELWEKAGRPPGKHLEFWVMAESHFKKQTDTPSRSETTSARQSPPSEPSMPTQVNGAGRF